MSGYRDTSSPAARANPPNADPVDVDPVDAVVASIRQVYGRWTKSTSMAQRRRDWDALFAANAVPAEVEPCRLDGVAAAWVTTPGADTRRTVMYFHGGGFQVGSLRSHLELMAGISHAARCRVLGVDYRLAPEHRYPAQVEDATTAWHALASAGHRPDAIALAGDSAGAGLALSLLLRLRDAGEPLPAGAFLMSPWTDLAATGESYETRAAADPINQRPMIEAMGRAAIGSDMDPRDPRVSPLFADLAGLPPLLLQAGDRETVLSDATRLADRAQAAGVSVELRVYPGMIHVFQQFPARLPAAREALAAAGGFLRRITSTQERG